MKTSELIGPALDWAVATCEGAKIEIHTAEMILARRLNVLYAEEAATLPAPKPYLVLPGKGNAAYSTDWSQGGPIIEREGIATRRHSRGTWYAMLSKHLGDGERAQWCKYHWVTSTKRQVVRFDGPTPLIAAMRSYIASKLGDEIDVPEELNA